VSKTLPAVADVIFRKGENMTDEPQEFVRLLENVNKFDRAALLARVKPLEAEAVKELGGPVKRDCSWVDAENTIMKCAWTLA
jgi:hypothetical protein